MLAFFSCEQTTSNTDVNTETEAMTIDKRRSSKPSVTQSVTGTYRTKTGKYYTYKLKTRGINRNSIEGQWFLYSYDGKRLMKGGFGLTQKFKFKSSSDIGRGKKYRVRFIGSYELVFKGRVHKIPVFAQKTIRISSSRPL